ncbi:hypothetical protein GV828_07240 [Flavobacterium sp. NST-5]|uniref:Uncharacterized protein n=1 Tax=Flavobacterium ichthyis TaxID=2698827 RepID=A0ABW9ZA02_9FLAO|nr:hypothetical protein [Flavobacterium ichthyis]NBL64991.1 hypothetical protein [Flavobacterium ichthyis]
MPNTFKLNGNKLVPLNRFNLEPAKPSVIFSNENKKPGNFVIAEHPVVQSIDLKPTVVTMELFRPRFPLIEDKASVNPKSFFKDFEDAKIYHVFPGIEISPNNNLLFYYEEILDANGKTKGYLGKVTLKYILNNQKIIPTQKHIPLELAEAILNLKIKDGILKISGIINASTQEITFELKDEAVKITFQNLITNIKENQCSVDLFFNFKAYSKPTKIFNIAVLNKDFYKLDKRFIAPKEISKAKLITPLAVTDTKKTTVLRANKKRILHSLDVKDSVNTELVKSTFILKTSFPLNYPLDKKESEGLYKNFNKTITDNPFNLNEKFSEFEQVFFPGFQFDKYTVYKSKVQPNVFLIVPKKYYLARDAETMSSCINLIFHAFEEGTGVSQDISKVNIQYAVSPNISALELNKLKIDLFQFGLLDDQITDYFSKVQFLFPNDIGADFEITGNHLIAPSEVSVDGKSFLFNFTTEKLSEASLLINSFNNSISQFANITIRHKEIRDTANMELNIEKTIGDFLQVDYDDTTGKLLVTNLSYSPCKISNVLLISAQDTPFFNPSYFATLPPLNSQQTSQLELRNLTSSVVHLNPKNICFEYESIEDISKEFTQAVATSTDFNRSIVLEFIKLDTKKFAKIQVDLVVRETDSAFSFEKDKTDFKTPLLFNFITKNQALLTPFVDYKVLYFDQNNNLSKTKNFSFNYTTGARIYIE